jgi:hypothetical protein
MSQLGGLEIGDCLPRRPLYGAAYDEAIEQPPQARARVLSRRIVNDPSSFLALLEGIDGESKVALEATYGWEWLAELLEEAGYELHLAHPLRTRAIAAGHYGPPRAAAWKTGTLPPRRPPARPTTRGP